MADVSITAANVVPQANAVKENGVYGEAVTAGQWVYRDATTRKYMLCDSNAGAAAPRTARGMAVNSGAANQPGTIVTGGDVALGSVLSAGGAYYLSDTPGAMCPTADVGSGEYVCFLGLAKSATVLAVNIQAVDAAIA